VIDEKQEDLTHFLRLLYSQAEGFQYLLADVQILLDLAKDLQRAEANRLNIRKVEVDHMLQYFRNVKMQIQNDLFDSHLTVAEGYQSRILNLLNEVEKLILDITSRELMPLKKLRLLEKI